MAKITPEELAAQIERGEAPAILDVRSQQEYDDGHVPGAIHVPFLEVGGRAASLPVTAHQPIVVYCGHGPRAWIAGAALRRLGFTRVSYLAGHMAAWRKAGLASVRR